MPFIPFSVNRIHPSPVSNDSASTKPSAPPSPVPSTPETSTLGSSGTEPSPYSLLSMPLNKLLKVDDEVSLASYVGSESEEGSGEGSSTGAGEDLVGPYWLLLNQLVVVDAILGLVWVEIPGVWGNQSEDSGNLPPKRQTIHRSRCASRIRKVPFSRLRRYALSPLFFRSFAVERPNTPHPVIRSRQRT